MLEQIRSFLTVVEEAVAIEQVLAAVGRTALSNYLLTSILCQFLFLWGPSKLYGKLEYYEYNYVVLAIWSALATCIPVRSNRVGMALANLPETSAHAD
ncbi:MAG TPA: DUF418 domain-containing protein [Chthoniobacterales bacterium]|jgi:uncharacterized membrane protein YeiB|nr:DUF418 domain-containing protein [Chthoniobacterales bacterium]